MLFNGYVGEIVKSADISNVTFDGIIVMSSGKMAPGAPDPPPAPEENAQDQMDPEGNILYLKIFYKCLSTQRISNVAFVLFCQIL